ncbi:YqjF family protein [Halogeometricum luteum]|uniref:DUF2071 domain-containing protein n=1 Tax=Halogeometricum luteum TaxID=2950537 RepID=A0ABU2FXH2_9EURY|nr:DUF2071 domain-containing protein [Halogeometricum sp. S3BR5-2]MDS0293235.1 DUF2071 domain-containing protein [Halogeometricum sp. S3BR5-2]
MVAGDSAFPPSLPLPNLDGLLRMRWRDALFAHWPVAPETVAARLPNGLDVATFDGRAWLGVVAFAMEDIRPKGAPFGLSFPELNLRTYVRRPGEDGHAVYFFNLDADDWLGVPVARRLYALPYYRADMRVRRRGEEIEFASHRTHRGAPAAHFDATYRPTGEAFAAEPGTLEHFLTENYRFYASGRTLVYGDIAHDPWPLREADAEFRTNTLFAANGFERPDADPLLHHSSGADVTAGRVHLARD